MNPEIKALWLTALRSGDYEQGKGALIEVTGEGQRKYCCLGVLCDLAAKAGIVKQAESRRSTLPAFGGEYTDDDGDEQYSESGAILPTGVMLWSEMETQKGEFDKRHTFPYMYGDVQVNASCLSEVNDCAGWDFNQIADLIEVAF